MITKFQLSINKYFSDKGYNFGQIFSSEFLSDVDDEASMENVIQNKMESLRLSELETDFSIITWPFDIFTSLALLGKYLQYLCPIIVLCVWKIISTNTVILKISLHLSLILLLMRL